MKEILILHGPNLNLTGTREPGLYGVVTLSEIDDRLAAYGEKHNCRVKSLQSNHEGELIDALHDAAGWAVGVVFNPGAYTHTSIALRDAVEAIPIPVIEVHLSNILARESFRRRSVLGPVCRGSITGFGWLSYLLGMKALLADD